MALGNSTTGYGCVSRAIHWIGFFLVAIAFGLAGVMTEIASGPDKFRLYGIHKSVGALVLGLGILRIVWTVAQPAPKPLGALVPWQRILAKAVHGLLLLWMVAMPLSGWLMSAAGGRPVSVFGWFFLPNPVAPDRAMAATFREMHEVLAALGLLLIGLHVAAALWHHFVLKDGTLHRMLPCRLGGCTCGCDGRDESKPDDDGKPPVARGCC